MSGAVVLAEGVVTNGAGGVVENHVVIRVEPAAEAENFHRVFFELGIAHAIEVGGRAGVVVDVFVFLQMKAEGAHGTPVGSDEGLDIFGDDSVLSHSRAEGERLPAVGVGHGDGGSIQDEG